MQFPAIGTSDEVDSMQVSRTYSQIRSIPMKSQCFHPNSKLSYPSLISDDSLKSDEVDPMQLPALGTSDEVDPMQCPALGTSDDVGPMQISQPY